MRTFNKTKALDSNLHIFIDTISTNIQTSTAEITTNPRVYGQVNFIRVQSFTKNKGNLEHGSL
jgi:hypothetical protein